MTLFIDISKKKESKILILGSYHPKNIRVINELKAELNQKGFANVIIAKDIIPNNQNLKIIYSEVEKLMFSSDYNLFIFSLSHNQSLIVELTTFLKSPQFVEKKDRAVVLIPQNFNISMLQGLLEQQELNVFSYFDICEIVEYCRRFILLN